MQITKFKFHERGNADGSLVFLETGKDIPFEVKRVYYIYAIKEGVPRGFHAHKQLQQALICLNGSCKIILDNGSERVETILDNPAEGLFVGDAIWREMHDFTPDAVLLVLASEYYDEEDYIRNYDEFLQHIKEIT